MAPTVASTARTHGVYGGIVVSSPTLPPSALIPTTPTDSQDIGVAIGGHVISDFSLYITCKHARIHAHIHTQILQQTHLSLLFYHFPVLSKTKKKKKKATNDTLVSSLTGLKGHCKFFYESKI